MTRCEEGEGEEDEEGEVVVGWQMLRRRVQAARHSQPLLAESS